MKRPLYSAPDSFSLLPLMALLPSRGQVGRLHDLTSSLYARFEKVQALINESSSDTHEAPKRLTAELSMLKLVLDWLAVKPE